MPMIPMTFWRIGCLVNMSRIGCSLNMCEVIREIKILANHGFIQVMFISLLAFNVDVVAGPSYGLLWLNWGFSNCTRRWIIVMNVLQPWIQLVSLGSRVGISYPNRGSNLMVFKKIMVKTTHDKQFAPSCWALSNSIPLGSSGEVVGSTTRLNKPINPNPYENGSMLTQIY